MKAEKAGVGERKMKTSFPMNHPAFVSRRFINWAQDCGYNDIFIPA